MQRVWCAVSSFAPGKSHGGMSAEPVERLDGTAGWPDGWLAGWLAGWRW